MVKGEKTVRLEQFAEALTERGGQVIEDATEYGYRKGWLEDMDVSGRDKEPDRRTIARIVHQFLRFEALESELLDISPAGELADLYDCRSCVMHVAQVYCKGIMEAIHLPTGQLVFGMEMPVTAEECSEILERVFVQKSRMPKVTVLKEDVKARVITVEEAQAYLQTEKNVLLIDVRPLQEYRDRHLRDAVHIPMNDILKNPYMVSEDRDRRLLLYCREGCQSEVAAQCLISAGYRKVCSFAWDSIE